MAQVSPHLALFSRFPRQADISKNLEYPRAYRVTSSALPGLSIAGIFTADGVSIFHFGAFLAVPASG